MATNQFVGLLGQFGLPTVSEEEMLAARTQQRLEELKVSAANARTRGPRKEQDFRYFGRLIGGALGMKLNPAELTPEEAKGHEAVATANSRYEAAVADNPDIAADPITAELTYQRKLAEALIQTGQYDKAIPMLAQAEQKRRAYEKQRLELKRLGLGIEGDELSLDFNRFRYDSVKRGEFATVYPKDSWNPNSGVDMYIEPETGDAVKYNADGAVVVRMDAGTFTTARPMAPNESASGSDRTLQQKGVSPSELKEVRAGFHAAQTQLHGAMKVYNILAEATQSGTKGINIMGAQGSITSGFTKVVDTLQGVARQIGGTVTIKGGTADGQTLDSRAAAAKYYKENQNYFEEELAQFVPENVRADAELAERYYAAIITLTNARMKAVEPGARQLSDEDFKRALRETAGATTSPEAFRHIMLGNVLEGARTAVDRLDWLPPTIPRDQVINPREYQAFVGQLNDFEKVFSVNFGTASNPGPGLTQDRGDGAPPSDTSDIEAYYGKEEF